MSEIEALLTDTIRNKGFIGVSIRITCDNDRKLTRFEAVDMIGHSLDVYQVYGECNIHDEKDIEFIVYKMCRILKEKFNGGMN